METLAERPTILAVDDIPENLALLSEILKSRYRVLVSTLGEEALDLAHRDPAPDLILLDVVLPDLDGFEVCRLLKADPKTVAGMTNLTLTCSTTITGAAYAHPPVPVPFQVSAMK